MLRRCSTVPHRDCPCARKFRQMFRRRLLALVCRAQTRPSLAAHARPLPHLALGNHAAADARGGGDSLLRTIPGAISRPCERWRARSGNRAAALGRPRLLQPRAAICIAPRKKSSRATAGFPRDYEAALALPGIGRYTAAAVLSIAYGEAACRARRQCGARAGAAGRGARRSARARAVAAARDRRRRFARPRKLPATGTRP